MNQELLARAIIGPMPPIPIERTKGILGPWMEAGLISERWSADPNGPRMSISLIAERAARFDLRAATDQRASAEGWILYEEAPQWLRELYDTAAAAHRRR